MNFVLETLSSKNEVDDIIRSTEDVVLVLRFGREDDAECLRIDHIVVFIYDLHM